MFNMKDYLLSKSFGEEQYDNELRFIVRHWFNNLLVDEKYVTDNKKSKRYSAIYNGKEYYLYPYNNKNKFVLAPRKDDLFVEDFDDIITFRKNEDSISLDIKKKINNKYSNSTYTFQKHNDYVRCTVYHKELNDKDNLIYQLALNGAKNPYEYFSSLQIRDCDYWYEGEMIRRPNSTKLSEKDSFNYKKTLRLDPNRIEEYSNNIPLISILDYRINKNYGVKKHFSL